ncbi:CHASE2 domain-containing sensor protein [Pullulanibacillus pueri]|uniref:Uncharacterized protein n=1 Tax=Pullulanibacillus pueri TaxID=1437324 RepID=A0A8J3EJ99_9BACL|nr:DUF5325 family protein [Pullulanibacillus pueri]MBM7680086.1 CHASE2 domain-containing sensor protein [Pullulanibacillus pueri]GGH74299.1 hypothetical protein GCM10007096_02380 [Pullulanibacillus pueri]
MNILFFLLAVLTVASLVAIGYGIAVASPLFTILSIVGVFVFMGVGFTLKSKLRQQN